MSKRGFIGSVLVAPWFIILFVFMLVIFFFIFVVIGVINPGRQEIMSEIENYGLSFSILSFFRMSSNLGTVEDLFYYYSKNFEEGNLNELKQLMKQLLPMNTCVEVLVNGEKIWGSYFNDCELHGVHNFGLREESYTFIDFDFRKITVNFYQPYDFLISVQGICKFLDKNQCLNWLGCNMKDGECTNE